MNYDNANEPWPEPVTAREKLLAHVWACEKEPDEKWTLLSIQYALEAAAEIAEVFADAAESNDMLQVRDVILALAKEIEK